MTDGSGAFAFALRACFSQCMFEVRFDAVSMATRSGTGGVLHYRVLWLLSQ
jgi:hypothetical protein